MEPGPNTKRQLDELGRNWKQGEHILISGGTGSGKTTLASKLVDLRVRRGGYVVVFVGKTSVDRTITENYAGWTRWTKWKRKPNVSENRILLWPDTRRLRGRKAIVSHQKSVFLEALDSLMNVGKWTVQFDEGLYMTDPIFMGLGSELAMAHAQGRSNELTLLTLCQRPANLPLIIYGSADHAFAGQTRVDSDLLRLSNLGGGQSKKDLSVRMTDLGKRDFLWIPARSELEPQVVNLKR